MDTNIKNSILDMATGAIKERVDYDVTKVINNILDLDEDRKKIAISVTSKATLCPTNPVSTALAFIPNRDGEAQLVEMVPQVPGQMALDGTEQASPKLLKLSAARQG